jgi:hypothetical protein
VVSLTNDGGTRVDIDDTSGICTIDLRHINNLSPITVGDYLIAIGHKRSQKLSAGTPTETTVATTPTMLAHQIKIVPHHEQPDAEAMYNYCYLSVCNYSMCEC